MAASGDAVLQKWSFAWPSDILPVRSCSRCHPLTYPGSNRAARRGLKGRWGSLLPSKPPGSGYDMQAIAKLTLSHQRNP